MHHRHLRPWELFGDEDEASSDYTKNSFDSLGSANSYEDEPWVAKYDKRNVIRKIFDREVWIQEPALRQIQDTIFVQALLTAFVISAIITAIFLAVSICLTCNMLASANLYPTGSSRQLLLNSMPPAFSAGYGARDSARKITRIPICNRLAGGRLRATPLTNLVFMSYGNGLASYDGIGWE
jgi:hypothetical protein